jgi:hypothetical protein
VVIKRAKKSDFKKLFKDILIIKVMLGLIIALSITPLIKIILND